MERMLFHQNRIILFLLKIVEYKARKSNKNNKTPLHWAAINNSKEMVQLLLLKRSDINAKDIGYPKIIILFFIKIMEIEWRKLDEKNKTPLHYAIENKSKEIFDLLIAKRADINIKDLNY